MSDVFDRLDRLVDEGDLAGVEKAALAAVRGGAGAEEKDLWRYVAWARLEAGRPEPALEAARKAEDALLEAEACFALWKLDDADRALFRFVPADDADEAESEWYRGLLAEFRGKDPSRHFRRAAKLAPDTYAVPVRLADGEIDEVVESALEALPGPVRDAVAGAVVEVRDLPEPHPDVDPLSLGLYTGTNLLERSVQDGGRLPAKIEVYRKNVERIARDRDEAVEELRITLLHEIGHHLGYDEEGLERLGLE
jgi:predicted Zn-dependent protease with MMP-like domain